MTNNFFAHIDYLEKEKKYSALTIKAYSEDIKSFENFLNQNHQITLIQVTYPIIRTWIVELSDLNYSATSINRKIASLKSFYKFLLKTKQIEINPFVKHQSLKTAKKLQIPFSEKEMTDFFDWNFLDNDYQSVRNKTIVMLFYTTGIRRAELINLQLSSVDFYNKTLKVLGKRNKERLVPLIDNMCNMLKEYITVRNLEINNKTLQDLFVLNSLKKLNETFVYRLINDYFSSVSQKTKKSPHVLRHTFATHLLNNGADLNSVKELLGHASLSSTQIYTHTSLAELKNAYNKAHPRSNL
jgi:integrase/recombinase XerC